MRTENSIRNAAVSLGGQTASTLLTFLCRMVFTRTLDKAYLGASGLFGDILTLLSLSELGIGGAIIFFMYEPVARNDIKKQKQLMKLYQGLYKKIGIFVAVVGFGLAPFVQYLIGDIPDGFQNVQLIYVLYVLNLVLNYFFSYKRAIIEANQLNYICSIYQYGFSCVQSLVQIIVLIVCHNFIIYLCVQVSITFLVNWGLARKADRMFPHIREVMKEELPREERIEIFRNIKAMFMHRLGGAIVNGTDNILLTVFGGLTSTGIYSNYRMVINTLTQVIGQVLSSITSSIGNLGATEDKGKVFRVFQLLDFANFWIFSFSSICLGGLINPFIELCFGKEYLLNKQMVLILLVNFYLSGMRQVVLRFRDALGLFWYDRYKALVESFVNLVVSILLARIFGIVGVFLGTMVSTLAVAFWIEPYILYKYGFEQPIKGYFIKYIINTIVFIINGLITIQITDFINGSGIKSFIVKIIVCLIIPNIVMVICFWKRKEFQYYKKMIIAKIANKKT